MKLSRRFLRSLRVRRLRKLYKFRNRIGSRQKVIMHSIQRQALLAPKVKRRAKMATALAIRRRGMKWAERFRFRQLLSRVSDSRGHSHEAR